MIYLKKFSHFESVLNYECLNCKFERVSIDTRQYKEGDLFVAISGENFNAFSYVESIIKQGCECIVFTQNTENQNLLEKYKKLFPRVKFIAVTDSIEFLQDLAKEHIHRLKTINPDLALVSISGSNGKTTCKEILKYILEMQKIETVATSKNDNNHLGVPLTLLKLREETQVGIIELGSNHPGEIQALYHLFIPDHVYVTNVGMTHMEFFPTLEDVFKEEGYPLNHIKEQQTAWVNSDDKYLSSLFNPQSSNHRLLGEKAQSFQVSNDSLEIWGEVVKNSYLLGKHNYHNLGAMLGIASSIVGDDKKESLLKASATYVPALMRSQWLELGNTKVFLDAYNANPSSMRVSLEAFFDYVKNEEGSLDGVKVIIGDMLELGELAEALHYEIGQFLKHNLGPDYIFLGDYAQSYLDGYGANDALIFKDVDEFLDSKHNLLNNCKYLFLKASRSLQLERILDNI